MSFLECNDYLLKMGKAADGVVAAESLPMVETNTGHSCAVQKGDEQIYPELPPNSSSFEGFLNAMVLVDGLKRAGTRPHPHWLD